MAFSLPWKKTIPTQVAEIVETQQSAAQEAEILFERADRLVESEVANESDWIWKPVLVLTICGILLSLIFTAVREYTQWLNRPVETVVVDGATRHIDKTVIANQVAAGINGRILELDLGAIQERLVEEPWINEVEVRRAWPPALRVKLIEEVPVARWGNRGLLNHQGDIFWPEKVDAYQALPELSGPSHETVRIMQQFRDLNSLFIRSGITLAGLELESRGAWTLHLNNGIKVVAGRDDLMPRLRRFIQVFETQLVKQQESIEEVDIRYTNGVAVKWKKGSGAKRS